MVLMIISGSNLRLLALKVHRSYIRIPIIFLNIIVSLAWDVVDIDTEVANGCRSLVLFSPRLWPASESGEVTEASQVIIVSVPDLGSCRNSIRVRSWPENWGPLVGWRIDTTSLSNEITTCVHKVLVPASVWGSTTSPVFRSLNIQPNHATPWARTVGFQIVYHRVELGRCGSWASWEGEKGTHLYSKFLLL